MNDYFDGNTEINLRYQISYFLRLRVNEASSYAAARLQKIVYCQGLSEKPLFRHHNLSAPSWKNIRIDKQTTYEYTAGHLTLSLRNQDSQPH